MNAPTPSLDDLRIDRSNGRNSGRRWPWVGAVCLLLVSGGGGWWWWTGPAQVAEVRTATARVSTGSTEESTILNASGYVTARRRATVSSKVTGKLVESALLAVIGGVIGGGVAYAGFHGYQTATMNFQTFSQVAFTLHRHPGAAAAGRDVCVGDGPPRRVLPRHPSRPAADRDGPARSLTTRRV